MRKLLSFVLAATMTLGSFGYAIATPADVEGTQYADAVNRLSALEILNGYEDGTFKPERTITRAEFAKIMTTTLGVGDAAKYAQGQTKFNDVPTDHWASGYINLAADLGIINGYGDGNFGPSDEVTYAQSITMIVRGLGYEPKASALGGYPGGYIAIASEKDITDDVTVVNNQSAIRGDVAIMVDNSLDVPMMEQISFGNNPEWKENPDKTILKDKHNIEEFTGTILATDKVDSSLESNEIKFEGEKSNGDAINDTLELLTEVNVDSLIGVEVSLWANKDNEVFLLEKETKDDKIVLATITDVEDTQLTAGGDDYDLSDDVKVYLNFDDKADIQDLKDADDGLYGYVVLDAKDDVVAINAFEGSTIEDGVVTKIDGEELVYVDTETANGDEDLDLADYDDGVVFLDENLNEISKDAVKVNSNINAFENDKLYIIVSNKVVEGDLEKVKADQVTIGGTKYDTAENMIFSTDNNDEFSSFSGISDLDDINGEAVMAILDLDGDVIMISGDVTTSSSTTYGIVTYGEQGSSSKATIFNKDGSETEYKFESRSEGSVLKDLNYFGKDANLTFAIMEYSLNSDGEIASDKNSIVEVDMNDNSITKTGSAIDAVSATVTKGAGDDYITVNKGEVDEAKYYISNDTVFMSAVDGGGLDPEVLSYESILDSAITANGEAVVIGDAGRDADMIVFINSDFEGVNDDSYYAIVTEEAAKAGGDYLITVDIAGDGEKEVVVKEADAETLKVGDIIEFKYDNKGTVALITNEVKTADNTNSTVKIDNGYLEVNGEFTKVADDTVAYDVSSYDTDGDAMINVDLDNKISLKKVQNYNTVKYLLDGDGKVTVVLVADKK